MSRVKREVFVMLEIAIVEDEKIAAQQLWACLERCSQQQGFQYHAQIFTDGLQFVTQYRPEYNIIFMDIMLPRLNGMDTARQLRKLDPYVCLVFTTNMAQFAINGYEVEAVDFILKAVTYSRLSSLFGKILHKIQIQKGIELTIRTTGGIQRILSSDIFYVEIADHLLLYHMERQNIESWGTLKKALEELPSDTFSQCNKSCIVNLSKIRSLQGNKVLLENVTLSISRGRKKEFLSDLDTYLRRG